MRNLPKMREEAAPRLESAARYEAPWMLHAHPGPTTPLGTSAMLALDSRRYKVALEMGKV